MDLLDRITEINLPEPRAWQKKALPSIIEAMNGGIKTVLCIPTGCGKTVFSAMAIAHYVQQGKRVMFVVDRLVLIQQTRESFEACGLRCDILQGNNSTYTNAPVVIASQQTLVRRNMPKNLAAIFVDECHSLCQAMRDVISSAAVPVIGLSATPFAKGLGKLFSQLLNPYTAKQATDDGVLVKLRVKECKPISVEGMRKTAGEFNDLDVEQRGIEIVGDVVKEYRTHANNKAIAFCATIKQCEALVAEFLSQGIAAAVFCANTDPFERRQIVENFAKPDGINVLASVAALSTGFDAPEVRTVLDCRPLSKSLSTYIQSVGRGLRSAPGKDECLLLDFTGNMRHFANDFVDFYVNGLDSLDDGEKRDRARKEGDRKEKRKSNGCPACKSTLWAKVGSHIQCLACGHTIEEQPEEFSAQRADYEVSELDIFAAVKNGVTNNKLWAQLSNYVQANSTFDHERDRKKALALYHDITGNWPKFGIQLSPTPDGKVNAEVKNKVKSIQIAWAKRRVAA